MSLAAIEIEWGACPIVNHAVTPGQGMMDAGINICPVGVPHFPMNEV